MVSQMLSPPVSGELSTCVLRSGFDDCPRWRPGERLHDLFEAQVDRSPDAVAVETDTEVITFCDLDARANRLAHYMLASGCGAGDVVALLFDRSAESYVAMLAVLKINAAYVPLDPAFPADRISYIVQDAGVNTILTQARFGCLAKAAAVPVIATDAIGLELAQMPAIRPAIATVLSDLAYVIYTSGSTGRPKGVPIDHAMIVNFVRVAAETYGYGPEDRVYQGLTLAFDFSVEEIWVPLLAGAALVPNQSGASLVGEDLSAFLAEKRITAMCCVPTLLATLEPNLDDLRLIIVSGEACPADIVARWHAPHRAILNAYGPTEITVTATISWLQPDRPVTIGMPLPTYSVVILDPETGVPLPHGEIGEIAIGGIGVSRGYLGREDLTARAFLPDTIGMPENLSGRIYKTGDLGQIDGSGQIVYLGRIDTQVKIRGYRIELSEIESTIMQMDGVRQAVVDTFAPDGTTAPELVAYYTGDAQPEDVAAILRQTLPPFMVPSYIEPLDAIPLLPSDKADRKALPAPVRGRVGAQTTEYVVPVTPTETALAEVLAEVMNLERVSVTADFFAGLGGNSLIMARFAAAVRSRLGMSGFALKDLYKHPDIRSFARQLDNSGANRPPHRRSSDARKPSDWAYWGTGLYQILASFGYLTAVAWVTLYGMAWTFRAETPWDIFGHAVAFSTLSFLFMSLLPVAAKWLLIGTWRPFRIRIWTLAYCRFWTVKALIRTSPWGMIPGTPLFTLYLKLLGAKVAWSALVQSPAPVVSDLFEVGENAVIGRDVLASGYVAEDGFIYTGAVKIGAGAFVGDGCVLGINTAIGDHTELGHASAMYDGQKLDDGTSYAGSPAEPCTDRFQTMEAKRLSVGRRALHAGLSLAMAVGVVGPIGVFTMQALYVVEGNDPSKGAPTTLMGDTTLDALPTILAVTGALFVGGLLLMMASTLIIPRLAYLFLKPGEIYPLLGARHFAASIVYRFSNSKFLNGLFGDSSYIVPWLRAVGYRIKGQHNTGSNFGMVQKHDVPYLCSFGEGTMVSDGLTMTNADFSASHFRLGAVSFGTNSFLGNSIIAPTGMALGDNVLLATKVQVPVHREPVSEKGLLGSPAFAIPRDHGRSQDFAHYADPKTLAKRLTLKNRYNLVSMALFLMHHWGRLAMVAIVAHIMAVDFGLWSATGVALISLASLVTILLWGVLVEALAMGFKRLKPQYCSIYDSYFWWHERYWKLSSQEELQLLNGTPFKPLFWRMLGVKIGRYVFDDGLSLTEKTLCSVGDLVTCNQRSTMQPHSLEDGAFQSGPVSIGDGAILGVKSFIHYGASVGAGVQVAADSFVMKGEHVPERSVWFGNPAQEAAAPITLSHVEAKVPIAVRSLENA